MDKLVLAISEDAYKGDAQYTLGIDGVQVAAGTATASHAAGASQAVGLSKALSAGMHDLSVSFLNDLYGNSATTDRNLYVKSVAVDGATVSGASATLLSAGTSHFEIYVP